MKKYTSSKGTSKGAKFIFQLNSIDSNSQSDPNSQSYNHYGSGSKTTRNEVTTEKLNESHPLYQSASDSVLNQQGGIHGNLAPYAHIRIKLSQESKKPEISQTEPGQPLKILPKDSFEEGNTAATMGNKKPLICYRKLTLSAEKGSFSTSPKFSSSDSPKKHSSESPNKEGGISNNASIKKEEKIVNNQKPDSDFDDSFFESEENFFQGNDSFFTDGLTSLIPQALGTCKNVVIGVVGDNVPTINESHIGDF